MRADERTSPAHMRWLNRDAAFREDQLLDHRKLNARALELVPFVRRSSITHPEKTAQSLQTPLAFLHATNAQRPEFAQIVPSGI